MLNNRSTNRIDPIFLFLLGIGDEVHSIGASGELEGELFVEDIFGSLDGEAGGHWDDATWNGAAGDGGFLEPEELAFLEDEPTATPGLDVLPLLCEPPGSLGARPELYAAVVFGGMVRTHRGSPQACHGYCSAGVRDGWGIVIKK